MIDSLLSPTGIIAVLIGVFCLFNLKSLIFVWHIRVFSAFFQHRRTSLTLPSASTPSTLTPLVFRPLVLRTRCSVLELDYILHKSNSTYFSDLDISRAHLLLALFKSGTARVARDAYKGKRSVMPVLGGAACLFKRAIAPGAAYEVVTRVLSWDDKWVFLVSWFVKPGSMRKSEGKSKSKSLDSKTEKTLSSGAADEKKDGDVLTATAAPVVAKNVYATAVAKYVVKAGRDTVKPIDVLRASKLLPEGEGPEEKEELERIEEQRVRALAFGKAFCELDGLHGEFDGSVDTLGRFRDLW